MMKRRRMRKWRREREREANEEEKILPPIWLSKEQSRHSAARCVSPAGRICGRLPRESRQRSQRDSSGDAPAARSCFRKTCIRAPRADTETGRIRISSRGRAPARASSGPDIPADDSGSLLAGRRSDRRGPGWDAPCPRRARHGREDSGWPAARPGRCRRGKTSASRQD